MRTFTAVFFHFLKNLKKWVRNNELLGRYNNDPNFALQARMIPAMAFVPPNSIEDSLEELRNFLPAELQPVLD